MAPSRRARSPVAAFGAVLIGGALAILPLAAGEGPPGAPQPAEAVEARDVITPVPSSLGADPERVALGRMLFADTRLSRGGDRACITCHDIRSNGASAAARNVTTDGTPMPRNTPTAFNAALSFRLGWRLCENAFVVWKDLTARCAKRPGFQPRMAAMSGPAPRIAITRFML